MDGSLAPMKGHSCGFCSSWGSPGSLQLGPSLTQGSPRGYGSESPAQGQFRGPEAPAAESVGSGGSWGGAPHPPPPTHPHPPPPRSLHGQNFSHSPFKPFIDCSS